MYTGDKMWKDSTVVIGNIFVVNGHRFVARQNRSDTHEFHNSVPCMIMDIVEVGAIIGLVAWNKKRRQRQFWVHPIYSERLSLGRLYKF
jgi:hypothetical protein